MQSITKTGHQPQRLQATTNNNPGFGLVVLLYGDPSLFAAPHTGHHASSEFSGGWHVYHTYLNLFKHLIFTCARTHFYYYGTIKDEEEKKHEEHSVPYLPCHTSCHVAFLVGLYHIIFLGSGELMGNLSSPGPTRATSSTMLPMEGAPADLEASWCQNCFGCSFTNVSFGHAFDVILLRHHRHQSSPPECAASRLYFSFPLRKKKNHQPYLEVWTGSQWLRFPIRGDQSLQQSLDASIAHTTQQNNNEENNNGPVSPNSNMQMDRWSDEPLSDEELTQLLLHNPDDARTTKGPRDDHDPVALRQLATALQAGKNPARFILLDTKNHTIAALAPCSVHLWSTNDRIVIMDIDGSITKSNVLGLVDTLVTEAYSYCHEGVCRFLSQLLKEGTGEILNSGGELRILYLSSRPLVLANFTRKFLTNVQQVESNGNLSTLPDGPLLGYSGSLSDILHMELITHSVHAFKHQAVKDNVLTPWAQLGQMDLPFWAALGNTWMDVQAYQAIGIPLARLGFITKQSIIHVLRSAIPPLQSSKLSLYPPARPPEPDAEHSFDSFRDPGLLQYFTQRGVPIQ
eukprot:scaffold425_cov175-Amphora_coffeaeformis.AAC.81